MVWPMARRISRAMSTERGIETKTMRVLRQLPRKRRIMAAVRAAAMAPSVSSPSIARVTKVD